MQAVLSRPWAPSSGAFTPQDLVKSSAEKSSSICCDAITGWRNVYKGGTDTDKRPRCSFPDNGCREGMRQSRGLRCLERTRCGGTVWYERGKHAAAQVCWRRRAGAGVETLETLETDQATNDEADLEEETEEEDVGSGGGPEHLIIEDGFLKFADQVREHFDSRFAEPRQIRMDRFVWDYWHVPNQYTLIRTPAENFFPKELFEGLEDALLSYGENKLGCRSISPVWLSYYVDGCSQELHADNPHGPWAFVLSLTDWEQRRFSGGETVILQPQVLDYWRGFEAQRGMELEDLVTLVEPDFNRLTVFDPRLPHGVRPVRGTQDPREARLVLHGWFTEPTPFFTGALEEHEAVESLNAALEPLFQEIADLPSATGTTAVRLTISGSTGAVTDLEWLTDTLVPVPGADEPGDVRDEIQRTIVRHLGGAKFPTSDKGETYLTMPFVFE